jgi:hypothetical protein
MGLAGNFQKEPAEVLVKNAVRWIRERRRFVRCSKFQVFPDVEMLEDSTKAIETPVQVLFVHDYIQHLKKSQPISAAQLLAL